MKRKKRSSPKRHALAKRKKKRSPLGENIKRARSAKGLTQLALAHAIGYTGDDAGAYVSRVEAGQQEPRLETLGRIAEALAVPVCSLLS